MKPLIDQLHALMPAVSFRVGKSFCWSPAESVVTYRKDMDKKSAQWSLLHEAAHAILEHRTYSSDLELLLLEVAAWEKAKQLAEKFGLALDEEHIQDCLDTYRDWLHQRSTCPRCSVVSLQVSSSEYLCHNCNARWQVSASRFCRPYRLIKHTEQSKSRQNKSPATFS